MAPDNNGDTDGKDGKIRFLDAFGNKKYLDASSVSKRQFLAGGAAAVSGLLAGCSGGDDDDTGGGQDTTTDEGSDGESGKTPVSTVYNYAHGMDQRPPDLQWNPYNARQSPAWHYTYDWNAIIHFDLEDRLYYPMSATDWNYSTDDNTFTIDIADNGWWDGMPLTAEDLLCKYTMAAVQGTTFWGNNVDEFEVVDEKTFRIHMSQTVNPSILAQNAIVAKFDSKRTMFLDYAEDVRNNLNDQATLDSVLEEITQMREESPTGNHIMRIKNAEEDKFTGDVNPHHQHSDLWEGVTEYNCLYAAGSQGKQQAFLAGESDVLRGPLPRDVEPPENTTRIATPILANPDFTFNINKEFLADPRVRKAIAFMIDQEAAASAMGNGYPVDPVSAGMPVNEETFLGSDWVSNLDSYEQDAAAAEELLSAADGWSKPSDQWQWMESTKTIEVIVSSGRSQDVRQSRTATQHLKDADMATTFSVLEAGTSSQRMNAGEWQITQSYSGGYRLYPAEAYARKIRGNPTTNTWPAHPEHDGEVEVPSPVGDPEASFDGDTEMVNVQSLVDELSQTTDSERETEIFRRLAWAWNQNIPSYQMSIANNVGHFNTEKLAIHEKGYTIRGAPRANASAGLMGIRYEGEPKTTPE